MKYSHLSPLVGLVLLHGCITPKEKKDMRDDIFNVQTRLLNIEHELADSNKEVKSTGDSAAKRIASTRMELEKTAHDIQQIRGEIDALKIGVQTGQMPGEEPKEGSVASQLTSLSERLTTVESNQEEILDAIKNAGNKKKGTKKHSSKSESHSGKSAKNGGGDAASLAELQSAFSARHYTKVVDGAPQLLKKGSGKDKERVRFLYAESLFKLGKLSEAALKYDDYIKSRPKEHVPLAKMRLGDCFRHLGDAATAKIYYEELIKEFPNSDEAAKAKERLADFSKNEKNKG